MTDIPLIYDDPRPIKAVCFEGDGGEYCVGRNGITKIAAYREHGLSDFTPYYAIFRGDNLDTRVPGHMVLVVYQDPAP